MSSHAGERLHAAIAFGCRWRSGIALDAFEMASPDDGAADITVALRPGPAPHRSLRRVSVHRSRAVDGIRYVDEDGITLDTYQGHRMEIHTGERQSRDVPRAFYGTLTAALLAWRGLIPVHGTAVELQGRAVLICGESGAGKSTLGAALIAQGARLISDDLSVLHPQLPGGPLFLFSGRRSMRLFADTAGFLGRAIFCNGPPVRAERKLAVAPPQIDARTPVPLHSVIFLSREGAVGTKGMPPKLHTQLFRPKLMDNLPGQALRLANLTFTKPDLASLCLPALNIHDAYSFERAGHEVFDRLLHAMRDGV